MGKLFRLALLLPFCAAGAPLAAQPLPGSQLPREENMCAMCHGDASLWQGDQARLHIPAEELAGDLHWAKGVVCHDCHGGDPFSQQFANTHRKEAGFRATAAEVRESCARCHREAMIDVTRKSVHAKAGPGNEDGEGTALDCSACHGEVRHALLSAKDTRSPVFLDNQAQTCGTCHPRDHETYIRSVHSPELVEPGPVATASCTDCHGTHGIYRKADDRSTLHASNVSTTCEKCHPGINAQLQNSVHALDYGLDKLTDPEEKARRKLREATCIACHQRHEPARLESLAIEDIPEDCGNCHAKLASHHAMRHHAELTSSGYVAAASCAECHGAHEIVPISDASSPLSSANRLQTCQKCHEGAARSFSDFDPHANYKDAASYPKLHRTHVLIEVFTLSILLFFMVHAVLWILRSLVHVLQVGSHKRPVAEQHAIIRFSKDQLMYRFLVMLSLLGLAVTGLLLKYADYTWAQTAARFVGGLTFASILHRAFGVLLLGSSAAYLIWLARLKRTAGLKGWRAILFGPDSPVPNLNDLKQLLGMLRWFIGMGPKPTFDRWTYWEKFDYWAIVSIIVFIGTSGLVIWWPNLFARFVSGAALNEAQMVHQEIALMATSFLLAIRYINTHFRPEKFPMDLSVVTGLVSEEHLQSARPQFLERLRQRGQLERLRTTFPSRKRLAGIIIAAGFTHVIVLLLLAVILVASLSK